MQTKTKRLIVLLELENGDVHQVIMTETQRVAIEAVLQSIGTVQLVSTPTALKVESPEDDSEKVSE